MTPSENVEKAKLDYENAAFEVDWIVENRAKFTKEEYEEKLRSARIAEDDAHDWNNYMKNHYD